MKFDSVDELAARAQRYNLDELIQLFIDWEPRELREKLTHLYFFASQGAFRADNITDDDATAFYFLQRIIEAMGAMDNLKEAKLTVRVK